MKKDNLWWAHLQNLESQEQMAYTVKRAAARQWYHFKCTHKQGLELILEDLVYERQQIQAATSPAKAAEALQGMADLALGVPKRTLKKGGHGAADDSEQATEIKGLDDMITKIQGEITCLAESMSDLNLTWGLTPPPPAQVPNNN